MAVFVNPTQNFSPRFSEDKLNEILGWFDENSKTIVIDNVDGAINVISVEKFMTFLELRKFHRREYNYPHYGEVMSELDKINAGVSRVLTKEQFLCILDKWVIEADIKHELKVAFKVFDSEMRNFLDVDEIRIIVTEYGNSFDENEILELQRDANVNGDGNVVYEEFVESLFSLAPELYTIKTGYLFQDPNEDPSVPAETTFADPIQEPTPQPPSSQQSEAVKSKKSKK